MSPFIKQCLVLGGQFSFWDLIHVDFDLLPVIFAGQKLYSTALHLLSMLNIL